MTANRFFRMMVFACCLPLLAGCLGGVSPPSRFYLLTALEPGKSAVPLATDKLLVIGPVAIPDYLNRPQIVTRTGTNELIISEFNRWGGFLGNNISRVITGDLSTRMGPDGFTVLPWQMEPFSTFRSSYRIPVNIIRFDGVLGKEVILNATWQLLVKKELHEQPLLSREEVIVEPVSGGSYEELVAAMGRALRTFDGTVTAAVTAKIAEQPH